jgi:ubiquinone/menaquinone biosynthesis C-methylase UbiE
MADLKSQFGYVDTTYLQTLFTITRPVKESSFQHMALQPGFHVLDVGCGPGLDTIPLAHMVGPTGFVAGIDHDPDMIAAADQNAAKAGVSGWVRHQAGDAAALPFDDHTFNASRSERLFQHLLHSEQVLAEMIRVTKPGGWIVVVDSDHSSTSVDLGPDPSLRKIEWKLRKFRADMFANGYAGRELFRNFKQQGLANITSQLFPMTAPSYALGRYIIAQDEVEQKALAKGVVTEAELARFNNYLIQADQEGHFMGYGVMILVAGQKL